MRLIVPLETVAQLALVLGFGGLLAFLGYLRPNTLIVLHRFIQVFLTPVLIYFSIAYTSFGLEDVRAHWHLALYFFTLVLLAVLTSWVIVRLASFSRAECQWIATSILFQDSTFLPLTVVQALANSVAGIHWLLQGPSDTRQGVVARGVGYVAMYSLVLSILQSIFNNTPSLSSVDLPYRRPYFARRHPGASSVPTSAYQSTIDGPLIPPADENQTGPEQSSPEPRQQLFELEVEERLNSFPPNEPWVLYDDEDPRSRREQAGDADDERERDDEVQDPSIRATYLSSPRRSSFRRRRRRQEQGRFFTFIRQSWRSDDRLPSQTPRLLTTVAKSLSQVWRAVVAAVVVPLAQIFTVPVLAAILALLVSVVPVLQEYIMEPTTIIHRFVINPLEESGACAVPLILLVTGAKVFELLEERRRSKIESATTGDENSSRVEEDLSISGNSNDRGSIPNSALSEPRRPEAPGRIFTNGRLSRTVGLLKRPRAMLKSLRWSRMTPMMCVLLLRNFILPLLSLAWTLLWRFIFTTPLTSDPMWCNAMVLAILTPIVPETIETYPRVKRILFTRYQGGGGARAAFRATESRPWSPQQQQERGDAERDDIEDVVAQEQQRRCYLLGYIFWLPALCAWVLLLSSISYVPRARVK